MGKYLQGQAAITVSSNASTCENLAYNNVVAFSTFVY